jgi:hypothetical protein
MSHLACTSCFSFGVVGVVDVTASSGIRQAAWRQRFMACCTAHGSPKHILAHARRDSSNLDKAQLSPAGDP